MKVTRPAEAAQAEVLTALRLTDQLLAGTSNGLMAFDKDLRIFYWGEGMERLSSLRAPQVIGRRIADLFPFVQETGEDARLRAVLAGQHASSRGRPYFLPATGKRGLYEAHYMPLQAEDGGVLGGAAVVRDVTEHQRALQRLEETEGRFRNMADAAPVLLWMSDTDGLCTFFNQSWLEFTGRTLEEEWGVGWAEQVHFEDFQRCMDTYFAAFNQRRRFEIEYRLQRADGEFRWILDRGVPRYAPDGTFAGFIGSCIDITDRKALEDRLRQAVRDREEFLSIASHELRTPLTALHLQMDSLLRTLARRPEEGLASGRALERIERSARTASTQVTRLTKLVDELLDVSRVAAGRLVLEREPVDLAVLAREVAARFDPLMQEAGCALEVHAPGSVIGLWDRARLDLVISNLLSNAIKYGPNQPVSLTVEGGDEVGRLIVRDRGIGIPPEAQARIFERFERAVSTRNYGGFGLGLWIAREVIAAHGGTIQVHSAPKAREGATFIVELPRPPLSNRPTGSVDTGTCRTVQSPLKAGAWQRYWPPS